MLADATSRSCASDEVWATAADAMLTRHDHLVRPSSGTKHTEAAGAIPTDEVKRITVSRDEPHLINHHRPVRMPGGGVHIRFLDLVCKLEKPARSGVQAGSFVKA
jgi:hypothetical protein